MKEDRYGPHYDNLRKERLHEGGLDPRISYNSSKVHNDLEKRLIVPSLN